MGVARPFLSVQRATLLPFSRKQILDNADQGSFNQA